MNATETYTARRNEIDAKLARIQVLLKTMDKREQADARNWGFAGNAGHIREQLDEILEFLGEKK